MESASALVRAVRSKKVQSVVFLEESLWMIASHSSPKISPVWEDAVCYVDAFKKEMICILHDNHVLFFNVSRNKYVFSLKLEDPPTCLAYRKEKIGETLFIGKKNGEIDVFYTMLHQRETVFKLLRGTSIYGLQVFAHGFIVHQKLGAYYYEGILDGKHTKEALKKWPSATTHSVISNEGGTRFLEVHKEHGMIYYSLEDLFSNTFEVLFPKEKLEALVSKEKPQEERLKYYGFFYEHILFCFGCRVDFWAFDKETGAEKKVFLEKQCGFQEEEELEEVIALVGDLKKYVLFQMVGRPTEISCTSLGIANNFILYDIALGERVHSYSLKQILSKNPRVRYIGAFQNKIFYEQEMVLHETEEEKVNYIERLLTITVYPIQKNFFEKDIDLFFSMLKKNRSIKEISIADMVLTKEMCIQLNDLKRMRKNKEINHSMDIKQQLESAALKVLNKEREESSSQEDEESEEFSENFKKLMQAQALSPLQEVYFSQTLRNSWRSAPSVMERTPEEADEREEYCKTGIAP